MSQEDIFEIKCPSCSSSIGMEEMNHAANCHVCGMVITLIGHLCPNCNSYHEAEGVLCLNCGNPLSKVCRSCQVVNWSGSEICLNCGESIDIIAMVASSDPGATKKRLNRQMESAQAIKMTEQLASNKRMRELLAIEEARQAEIRRQSERQKAQERTLLIIFFGAVVLILIIVVLFAIVSANP